MNAKFVPRISQPCSQDWATMTGDDKKRFCEHCQLHVHNLSAMTAAEQQTLLSQRGTRQCIAYLASDDSLRVRTSTWLWLQRILRPWRAGLALLAMLLPLGISGCATAQKQEASTKPGMQDCKQAHELPDSQGLVKGGILYEPPLWRRILFFWER